MELKCSSGVVQVRFRCAPGVIQVWFKCVLSATIVVQLYPMCSGKEARVCSKRCQVEEQFE
eukprot:453777-Pyramimonas_sp.AAC.1